MSLNTARKMLVSDMDFHCGDCGLIDYCGEPYYYAICKDQRFADVEVDTYEKIAEKATGLEGYSACKGCERPDCDVYRYGADDYSDEPCDHMEESRDHYSRQVANFVYRELNGGKQS